MEDISILKIWISKKECKKRDLNYKNISIKKICPSNITVDNILKEFNIQKRYYNIYHNNIINEYFKVILKVNTIPLQLISYLEYFNFINDINTLNKSYDKKVLTIENILLLKNILLLNFNNLTPNIYYYNKEQSLLDYMNNLNICNFNIKDLNYLLANNDNYYLINKYGYILKDAFDLYNEILKNKNYQHLEINNDIIIFKKIN
tara:strand:+ start:261 stop:872 length:612 start_codon:yes stop_codon:yes gene_type:complete